MAENSAIEWTDHTVNWWWGCVVATLADGSLSEACRNCYAETFAKRTGRAKWGPRQPRWLPNRDRLAANLRKWNKRAAETGVPERVFCNSMSDFFEEHPILEDAVKLEKARAHAFALMQECTHLRFLVLTKRPENVRAMVPSRWTEPDVPTRDGRVLLSGWPSNVWLGTTVEDQRSADERIPFLLRVPATVRFLSAEPLLGPVDLARSVYGPVEERPGYEHGFGNITFGIKASGISWVIAGGESGHGARPSHPDWFRSLRDQCTAAGVPFLFKQWGAWVREDQAPPATVRSTSRPTMGSVGTGANLLAVARVGKKAAGRLLDGRTWDEVPS